MVLNFNITAGITTVDLKGVGTNIKVLIADYDTATRLWMPTLSGSGTFADYVDVSATTPLLISGPYLVRSAQLDGGILALVGDIDKTTTITVFGPTLLNGITWNGKSLNAVKKSSNGGFSASVTFTSPQVSLPDLLSAQWKYADSLPEIGASFDDSDLVDANHTSTTSVFLPFYGSPWILYADDYGFHVGLRPSP